ncbi:MAG: replication protein RepA [Thermoanaerobaculia bacterium]
MPRILVLATLPHSLPSTNRIDRINGRFTLRMEASRSIGLPYGTYPRLVLAYLTTEALRTKNTEIHLGRTPNDFIRKLGLTPISGPRGTSQRLQEQLRRLRFTRFTWQSSVGLHPRNRGRGFVDSGSSPLLRLARERLSRRPVWHPRILLGWDFFEEITRSAVPVDLRAIHQLKGSPFAIDLYVWLTHRMSYLQNPTRVSWQSLQAQFGADYSRPRDFRRKAMDRLAEVIQVYSIARLGQWSGGLVLYPSPPHVPRRAPPAQRLLQPSSS